MGVDMLPRVPSDFMALVEAGNESAFFPRWQDKVGQYTFYRIAGFYPVLKHAGIPFAAIFNNSAIKDAAIKLVPPEWTRGTNAFQTPPADWDTCKKDQIGWARDTEFQRFDKACLSILHLYAALQLIPKNKIKERYDHFDF